MFSLLDSEHVSIKEGFFLSLRMNYFISWSGDSCGCLYGSSVADAYVDLLSDIYLLLLLPQI